MKTYSTVSDRLLTWIDYFEYGFITFAVFTLPVLLYIKKVPGFAYFDHLLLPLF